MFAFGDLGTVLPWQTEQEQQPPSGQTVHWLQRDLAALGDTPSAVLHIGMSLAAARITAAAAMPQQGNLHPLFLNTNECGTWQVTSHTPGDTSVAPLLGWEDTSAPVCG